MRRSRFALVDVEGRNPAIGRAIFNSSSNEFEIPRAEAAWCVDAWWAIGSEPPETIRQMN
jgi:hypothetical protein